jgi:hypothetical protein
LAEERNSTPVSSVGAVGMKNGGDEGKKMGSKWRDKGVMEGI